MLRFLAGAAPQLVDAKDNNFGLTPLMLAAKKNGTGQKEACLALLQAGADPTVFWNEFF